MILLLIRLLVFIALVACVISIPYFLLLLREADNKKKISKAKENKREDVFIKPEKIYTPAYKGYEEGTPKVKQLFALIEKRQAQLIEDKKWLELESVHRLTDTFAHDFKEYKKLYAGVKDKVSVEENAVHSLNLLNQQLNQFEEEIEKKKKMALNRQGYIIEKRQEKQE